jgi:uncharacterized membrane protein YczE
LAWSIRRLAIYLSGCGAFSVGAYLFIRSELGADPLDVFALGLLRHAPLTIGLIQAAVAITCVGIVSVWTRGRPAWSPILTFLLCGSLIDVLRLGNPPIPASLSPYAIMIAGALLCAYGSSLIIMSGFGLRAMDLLAVTMVQRWTWPFWLCKGSLELILLGAGYLMGGPVGVGTLGFLLFVNTLITPMISCNERILTLPNFGALSGNRVGA